MKLTLLALGHSPSLALRSLARYVKTDPTLVEVDVALVDRDIRPFLAERGSSDLVWSFSSHVDRLIQELLASEPDVLGVSCYLWSVEISLAVAARVKALRPGTRVVAGGPDVGPRAATLLAREPALDLVVRGEGELPLAALLGALARGDPLDAVPGLSWRHGEHIVENPRPEGRVDLRRLAGVWDPAPSRAEVEGWGWPYLLFETQRGCPYRCGYCMYGRSAPNPRPLDFVDELAALMDQGHVVELCDPTFTTMQERAKQILRALIERRRSDAGGLYIEAYADSIDDELARLLKAAGVVRMGVGLQTSSVRGLRAASRPENLERFAAGVARMRAHELHFYVDTLCGLPETTLADHVETLTFLLEHGIVTVESYRLLGLPGSPMVEEASKHGMVFAPSPPWELLASRDWPAADLARANVLNERFRALSGRMRPEVMARLARVAGGLDRLLDGLASGGPIEAQEDAELSRRLAAIFRQERGTSVR
ncbi:MAG: cobalamin-dependent protein [Deltaproteobacteria bacterium]|nr:cobalamin-dependent protein [Deltaproteobacteria bacterium]